jgi:SAM-dependent methyltransferase
MRRTSCSACGAADLSVFLDLGPSPIADAYTAKPGEETPRFPLQVAVCVQCKLVQLLEVVPADVLFGTGYSFYSSASPPLSLYHRRYADDVKIHHSSQAVRGVLEVGCNDGDMLRHFIHLRHLGVDPATGPIAAARARGCNVLEKPFGLAAAASLRAENGPFGLVIANHVLAHVEDVSDFLAGIAAMMDTDSLAMIEVQYLPDLLVNNAFDLVYHEHRNFFSLTSLEIAAARHRLRIVDAELTDRQGGSLRITLSRSGTIWPATAVESIRSSEAWLRSFSAYDGMQGRAERIRERLGNILADHRGQVAIYGAPAKLTTLAAFCRLDVDRLGWCVDSTPAKQGRYLPGTSIPIVAPSKRNHPDAYLLAAWNYAATIMARNPGNRWILAIPAPVVL